jgi:hypothetical protein
MISSKPGEHIFFLQMNQNNIVAAATASAIYSHKGAPHIDTHKRGSLY